MNSNSHTASKLEHLLTVNCQPQHLICVDLTPDGQILVIGESTKIQLWNVSAKQPIRKLIKVSGCLSIDCAAISADGKTLACASGRGIIKVWNLHTEQQSLTFRAHRYPIRALALSHDGQIMASSANDGTLRVWNLKKVREVGFYIPSPAVVNCLALTPDGQSLVYGRFSSLIVWNWKTGKEIELEGHSESITTVAIAADGKIVASGSYDRTIKVWNLAKAEEIYTLTGHSEQLKNLCMPNSQFRPPITA